MGDMPASRRREMFSITTMASSTTKPVEIVSAISERLSMLKPNRYITAKVPISEDGNGDGGNERGSPVAQKDEDDKNHQDDGENERALHIADRGADGGGAVHERWWS